MTGPPACFRRGGEGGRGCDFSVGMGHSTHTVSEKGEGQRLDRYLKELFPKISNRALRAGILAGEVRHNTRKAQPGARLAAGDVLLLPQCWPSPLRPEPLPCARTGHQIGVLYRDQYLGVFDKPAGVPTAGGAGHDEDSLLFALRHRWPGGPGAVYLVHRLDRQTSGAIAVAFSKSVRHALEELFRRREVLKEYFALVRGVPEPPAGGIEAPLLKKVPVKTGTTTPAKRQRRSVVAPSGRPARTTYETVRVFRRAAWVRCRLHTGRTHQLRVHLAALGCPLYYDPLYGGRPRPLRWADLDPSVPKDKGARILLHRLPLHAAKLAFIHPVTGQRLEIESPLPRDLKLLLRLLERQGAAET